LCAGNAIHLPYTFSAFNQRQNRHAAGHEGVFNLLCVFGLGQHDRAQARQVAQRRQVSCVPGRACRIHTHQEACALASVKGRPSAEQCSAGHVFGVQRHRVFQVDDHRIGAAGQGLGKTLGAVAGHKQKAARL